MKKLLCFFYLSHFFQKDLIEKEKKWITFANKDFATGIKMCILNKTEFMDFNSIFRITCVYKGFVLCPYAWLRKPCLILTNPLSCYPTTDSILD